MWIKICANTNLDDALLAVESQVDAVGFVFAPSKRQVDAERVAAITSLLPLDVERVGVFQGATPEDIAAAVSMAKLTAVQLHDAIDLEFAATLRALLGPDIGLIHTVAWNLGDGTAAESEVRQQLALLADGDRVLIDAKMGSASGGLGISFDWARARLVLADFPALRVIVAGGLTPGNVAEAITTLAPYGVDVASGVELSPGHKDPGKLRAFIENARRA